MTSTQPAASAAIPSWRRLPVGLEIGPHSGVHARVWASKRQRVDVVLLDGDRESSHTELEPEGNGYFSGSVDGASAGSLYKYRLDGATLVPDPASRFQPMGPHGPSQVIDPSTHMWRDDRWRGVQMLGQVIYELHVGTFTREGTYRAAIDQLPHLADTGITVIEMMPIAEFPGRFGWGYDGVDLFAPYHLYGLPDDLRAFVDAAHQLGIGVLLDVVYNHLGPDGNYLREFSDQYFKGQTEWGEALNFDGEESAPVREFFLANAGYWASEFHFDGLRLDATQQIFDSSTPHILTEIVQRVQDAASGRDTIVIGENEPQQSKLIRPPDEGGCGLAGVWNDDFHHSAVVALTGRNEAYYSGYRGSAQEFVSAAKYGFLYQGQWYEWQRGRRGTSTRGLPAERFVVFTQNHDQIANAATGERIHQLASPARYRAVTALHLLAPQTPMLFMGQEFAASTPFLYFADHNVNLAKLVRRGRAEFLGQFASIATPEMRSRLDDPADPLTFTRCKLDWSERDEPFHARSLLLVRDLLRLRRDDPTLRAQGHIADSDLAAIDGAVINDAALLLRWFGERPELDRLLLVNLGARVHALPLAEPLAAPPSAMLWRPLWSSDDPRYGGGGTPPTDTDEDGWWLPAECTVLLAPVAREQAPPAPGQPTAEKDARAQWKAQYETTAG